MKVKEVKKRIGDLEDVYDNIIRIQECCLRNEDAKVHIEYIENKASLNATLRNLVSVTAGFIGDEIHRLHEIIDNADIEIN
nr:hypothetical protein [uncultured Schaedlerella sp.]